MTENRGPQYATPAVTVGNFLGTPTVDIHAGWQRVSIRPEDAHDVVKGMADVLAWINDQPVKESH